MSNQSATEYIEELQKVADGWKELAEKWKGLFELVQMENKLLRQKLDEIKVEEYQHITDGT